MYSLDLRTAACKLRDRWKLSYRELEKCLGISKSAIQRWVKNSKKDSVRNSSHGSKLSCFDIIRKFVIDKCNTRLIDIKTHLGEKGYKSISLSTICRYLRRMKFSYKKVSFQNYTDLDKLKTQVQEFENKKATLDKN